MFKAIPIKKIIPSPNNYRKTIDKEALAELAASIKSKGVLQPILVRPIKAVGKAKTNGQYEIVAGHRRFSAATAAGLKEMPVMVRDLSDEDALEIQVIENTQREDPNPMEEAWGFKRLMDMGKHTPETLATKLDRSAAYVLGRVKLTKLEKSVQGKIASGEIPMSVARLFTRLATEGDQKNFMKEILDSGYVSYQYASRCIRSFFYNIADARFDTANCGACASNSANQSVLFPEAAKAGECTNRSCFDDKTKEHYKKLLREKQKAGFKVYSTEAEVEKLTGYSARATCRISTKNDAYYSRPYPARYKTDCAKCLDHHAYFFVEKNHGGHKTADFGEICLDKKCLDKMNKTSGGNHPGGSVSGSPDAEDEKRWCGERSRACRNRFLLKEMPARVAENPAIQARIILFHILSEFSEAQNALKTFLKDSGISTPTKNIYFTDHVAFYRLAASVPVKHLAGAVRAVVLSTINEHMRGQTLLQMAHEAGFDVAKSFAIDREYLESQSFKNKSALVKLAKELALTIDENASTEKIVEAILAQDLKGKVPAEIAETFELEDGAAAGEDDDTDNAFCPECGEDPCECN